MRRPSSWLACVVDPLRFLNGVGVCDLVFWRVELGGAGSASGVWLSHHSVVWKTRVQFHGRCCDE